MGREEKRGAGMPGTLEVPGRDARSIPASSSDPGSVGGLDCAPVQAQATEQERSPWAGGHSRGKAGK